MLAQIFVGERGIRHSHSGLWRLMIDTCSSTGVKPRAVFDHMEADMYVKSIILILGSSVLAINAHAESPGAKMPTYPLGNNVQLAPAPPPTGNPGNSVTIAPSMLGGRPGTNSTPPTQGSPGMTVTIPIK
jgi:hypothetical protein